jgi:FkbM family methyltransferase
LREIETLSKSEKLEGISFGVMTVMIKMCCPLLEMIYMAFAHLFYVSFRLQFIFLSFPIAVTTAISMWSSDSQSTSPSQSTVQAQSVFQSQSTSQSPMTSQPLPRSYSQIQEDRILYGALSHVTAGYYIDVGANSPVSDSVTKAFYDMGWHGINIEPLVHRYNELVADRPRDVNLNIGCGAHRATLTFSEAELSSTFELDFTKSWKSPVRRLVPVYPLSEIVTNFSVKECHFCKIDVEGFEKDVLLGFQVQ